MTTARGRYDKGRRRRAQILDTALEVFTTGGFHASSTKEIARRVGVTEPTLFHYFGSKQALLAAVLEARDERSAATSPGPEGLLDAVRDNRSEPGLVRLYAVTSAEATDPDHAAHAWFTDRYARLRSSIAADLERRSGAEPPAAVPSGAEPPEALSSGAVSSGAVPSGAPAAAGLDPQRVARLLLAAADGLQIQWLLDRAGADPEGIDMAADLRALAEVLVGPPG
ncbi:TetR/AcrR family transcriptional regulator [Pseudonocardia sp. ICBG1293]|uniref:TetR/AcrR family transcriptional regulator n=1 Tax=Pseudonocardia sp. ICBG1293 TaxID=2844382 RepID=UPI001CCFA208|nr:TetR/AcrR family transcriptional regulator [Pseudonocardia sp. ICBG1293]